MIAKLILDSASTATITAEKVKVVDGFLQFKNASMDESPSEEEVWIPVGAIKTIVWKDKPEKEDKKE